MFIALAVALALASPFAGASTLSDKLNSLSDISFSCKPTQDPDKLSEKPSVAILETVDCGAPEARWDFQVQVRVSRFLRHDVATY
jgi:hypothetical protein